MPPSRALRGTVFLIPLPLNSWPLPPAPVIFMSSPTAPANIIIFHKTFAHQGLSICGYLNSFWMSAHCSLSFSSLKSHELCQHILQDQIFVNELRICCAANPPLWSFQSSLLTLDPWSVKSDSCSSCWMQGYQVQVGCSVFSPKIGLLLNSCHGLISTHGLKVWNIA